MTGNMFGEEYYEDLDLDLDKAIADFEEVSLTATPAPWYIGDLYEGYDGGLYCAIGPDDMSDKEDKHPYEATIADFHGTSHDAVQNAKLAALAVYLVPLLIKRVKELEKESAKLPKEVVDAVEVLKNWRS